jgi:hypothetical protein
MANAAPIQPNRETLTIRFDGRDVFIGRQHIIDTAAQVGWLITDDRAFAVQDLILSLGWRRAVRESNYGVEQVYCDLRNFVGACGADVEFWLELALARRERSGAHPNDAAIAVMQGLIARRQALQVAA